ncbi:MAG: hypothetical protein JSV56_04405 [Methanomassiliicoccales archaeon]|nr:MAG: hypothetical protein JSV56_04405 [Methanomassiliicoccales archaeon]
MLMNSGGCAGPNGISVTYSIMKMNYSIIGKEMIPRQRNILVETFDRDGNVINAKLDSAIEAEKYKCTGLKEILRDEVERLDFTLENLLSHSTLKLIPSLPNMRRYWLEEDGFVRGENKYKTVEPPARLCFTISKSLVEVCVGESPEIELFNELKEDLKVHVDIPKQGQSIITTSEHACVLMLSTYYIKTFIKEGQETALKIANLSEKVLKKYPRFQVRKYSRDLPKIFYRYLPGIYEDEEANTCEPKENSYNVSFRFGFWQPWFEIIIAFEILPEKELLNSFTVSLRNELFDMFNSFKN